MKVFVYGTLKEGYGNNRFYLGGCKKLGDDFVLGFKLKNHGFPVALRNQNTAISGEVWEIPDETRDRVVQGMDRLEGHPHFYQRTPVTTLDGHEVEMYVGVAQGFFHDEDMPINEAGVYSWNGYR